MLRRNKLNILHKLHIVLTIVLALSLLVVTQCEHTKQNINEDEHATNIDRVDTVVCYEIDTITETKVLYKDRLVKDTVYLSKKEEPFLLLVQKHFQSIGLYDVWVSGIEPLDVDSMKVYPKIEYRYITHTKQAYDNKGTDLFGVFGFSRFNDAYSSNVGICALTDRKWLYGAEIGLIDNKLYVEAKFGFKINNK
jgi:hypothetical protein